MKVKGQLAMESCPDFSVHAETDPITFKTRARGSLVGQVSSICVRIGEIPINLTIPFLRGGGGTRQIASIGSFGLTLSPFTVAVKGADVQLAGVLGTKKGISCRLDGKVNCRSKLNFNGKLFGKIANCTIDLPNNDEPDNDECKESVDMM